ncbi:MAG: lipoyl synthase [Calditrichaeota bacterium]|nr:lipoyl synthase [Calditrichota bacterium]
MPDAARRPDWLKVRLPHGETFHEVKAIVDTHHLHTVCESARCPNMAECWGRRTATFMILGDICTRSCRFCAVKTGRPTELDELEPFRVAEAVKQLKLRHAVITSVNRDELKDGGAGIFAETIRQIRKKSPGCRVEVLIPDFQGDADSLKLVIDARPTILNHNVETVPRLYKDVRPQAKYERSLRVLEESRRQGLVTKSGIMVGLGETPEEVLDVMRDLRKIDCAILTIGQYLQPTKAHLPVDRFVHPDEFQMYREEGLKMGFRFVESGPLVRSSYHADEQMV